MLILTILIVLGNQPASCIITGEHFGTMPTVAPINKVTLLTPNSNYHYEKYELNMQNQSRIVAMSEYLTKLNRNFSISRIGHFQNLTQTIINKQNQVLMEYVNLESNFNFSSHVASTLETKNLLNDSEFVWLLKKCEKMSAQLQLYSLDTTLHYQRNPMMLY